MGGGGGGERSVSLRVVLVVVSMRATHTTNFYFALGKKGEDSEEEADGEENG